MELGVTARETVTLEFKRLKEEDSGFEASL